MEHLLVTHEHSIHACASQVVAWLLLWQRQYFQCSALLSHSSAALQAAESSFLSMRRMQPTCIWRLPIKGVLFCLQ